MIRHFFLLLVLLLAYDIFASAKDLNCNYTHLKNEKCSETNDPCYFLPNGEDNTTPFDPDMKSFLKRLPQHGCTVETRLLIGIMSRPCDFESRMFVRKNWGGPKEMGNRTKLIFFMGRDSNNDYLNYEIMIESLIYGDILHLDLVENYRNLTLKMFGLLNYADKYCKNLKCLLKADQDTTLDISGLEEFCKYAPVNRSIYGYTTYNVYVERLVYQKWYVPYYVFPHYVYPPYAKGASYMITGNGTISKLLSAWKTKTNWTISENLRLMPEDLTVTGLVRESAGVKLENNSGFSISCYWKENHAEAGRWQRWCHPKTKIPRLLGFENRDLSNAESWKCMKEFNAKREKCK